MSLHQRKFLYSSVKQVAHGAAAIESDVEIDVSHVHHARVQAKIIGKDGASNGTFTLEAFGVINALQDTKLFDSFTMTANGLTEVIESKLMDVRGFSSIKVEISYVKAGDYCVAEIQCGLPFAAGSRG